MIRIPDKEIMLIQQYLGLWAIEPSAFDAQLEAIKTVDWDEHLAASYTTQRSIPSYSVADGVATIDINGTLTKYGTSLGGISGGMRGIRSMLADARNDKAVDAVVFVIDSPGGTVKGMSDLLKSARALAGAKPVVSFIEDTGTSAAYWLAATAQHVMINSTRAVVGSIGAIAVVQDVSEKQEKEGIRTIVVRSGKDKAIGSVEGEPLTDEVVAEITRRINEVAAEFIGDIVSARHIQNAEEISTGKVFLGDEAIKAGLVDSIGSYEDAVALARRLARGGDNGGVTMDTQLMQVADVAPQPQAAVVAQPVAATFSELSAIVEGTALGADFIVAAQREGWTEAQANKKALKALNAKLEERVPAPAPATDPVASVGSSNAPPQNPREEWNALVAEKTEAGLSHRDAVCSVIAENPELAERLNAYVAKHVELAAAKFNRVQE